MNCWTTKRIRNGAGTFGNPTNSRRFVKAHCDFTRNVKKFSVASSISAVNVVSEL